MNGVKGLTPNSILAAVNHDLSMENPSMMFITLFLGILNVRTGKVVYSNGGHNPPYIVTREGICNPLENTKGIALGVMEDAIFESKTIVIEKEDLLFPYTDGVTEAINQNEELFSEKRLENVLTLCRAMTAMAVVEKINRNVEAYTEDMEQFDDIAMLAIEFFGTD